MKKYLIVYYGDAPECVEKFGKDCKRSCKGALHVNPGRQLAVTEDEYEHIKKTHAHMLPKLRVLSVMEPQADKQAAKESEPKKLEEKAVEKEAKAQEESRTGKKKNRR
jgi:hypothetical protein